MIATLGSWLVALASVTVTFNAVRPLQHATLSDIPLFVGGAVLLGAFLSERYTWPIYPLGGTIAALLLAISVAASTAISRTPGQDLVAGTFFLIGAVVTPLVVAAAARTPATLDVIISLWAASGAVNGAVAALDGAGVTTLGPTLTGLTFLGRQAGLTVQPNHLGLACAMVIPVGFVFVLFGRRISSRMVWAAVTVLAVVGVLESGSRGAAVGIAIGPAVSAFLISKRRMRTLAAAVVLVVAVASIGVLAAQYFPSIGRLTGQLPVQGADLARIGALSQALNDIGASPIVGNGYGYARDAHDLYLQALAAGGALGLLGLLLLLGTIAQLGVRSALRPELSLHVRVVAAGLVGSLFTWLAVGIVENPIYDRYLYWPAGLLLAVHSLARTVDQGKREDTRHSDSDAEVAPAEEAGSQHNFGTPSP